MRWRSFVGACTLCTQLASRNAKSEPRARFLRASPAPSGLNRTAQVTEEQHNDSYDTSTKIRVAHAPHIACVSSQKSREDTTKNTKAQNRGRSQAHWQRQTLRNLINSSFCLLLRHRHQQKTTNVAPPPLSSLPTKTEAHTLQ